MKWETIKSNCIRSSYNMITSNDNFFLVNLHRIKGGEKPLLFHANKNALHDEISRVINNWDIRSYQKLRDIFPNEFPKGDLVIEYNEYWTINKKRYELF